MTVLDASAILAFLQDESGAEVVEQHLQDGAICGAANWSETAQKVRRRSGDWPLARGLLLSYGLLVEPVSAADGELAADLWAEHSQLSLGDRLCLALGRRLDRDVVTADRAWGSGAGIRQIRDE